MLKYGQMDIYIFIKINKKIKKVRHYKNKVMYKSSLLNKHLKLQSHLNYNMT